MRKQTKIVAALSATALLALGASAMTFAAGWDNSTGTWQYLNNNNEAVTDAWRKSGDYWYYLDSNGNMLADAIVENSNNDDFYYVGADGAMVANRWVALANDDDDVDADYRWYYFGSDGKGYRNTSSGELKSSQIKTINGKKYSFDEDGRMLFGWVNADTLDIVTDFDESDWDTTEDSYYFGDASDGAAVSGWFQISVTDPDDADDDVVNAWFYADSNGKIKKDGTQTINGQKYYFDEHGIMSEDWVDTDTKNGVQGTTTPSNIVYTNGDGATRRNQWIWAVAAEEVSQKDYDDEEYNWWWAKANGKLISNETKKINGRNYAFDRAGRMLVGLVTEAGGDLGSIDPEDYNGSDFAQNLSVEVKVDVENDDVNVTSSSNAAANAGLYYYSDSKDDGSRKTGYVNVEFEDDTYQMYFNTSNGKAEDGYVSKIKKYVSNGIVLKADADENKYAALVTTGAASISQTVVTGEIVYEGLTVNADYEVSGDYKLVNTTGAVQKNSKNLKDSNDNYWWTDSEGNVIYFSTQAFKTTTAGKYAAEVTDKGQANGYNGYYKFTVDGKDYYYVED